VARATAAVGKAGIPAVAIVCQGFNMIAQTVAKFEGLLDLRMVTYPPPNISVQHPPEVSQRAGQLVDNIIYQLSRSSSADNRVTENTYADKDIVLKGDIEELNRLYYQNQWTDGLPIMPPTIKAVEEMLKFTDRSPDEIIGILPPGKCAASIWKIAVNGVMAGCKPEYMPVLIAITEAVADPRFGLQHAGSTAGWTPLIILNGPIMKELDFNYGQGVLRPERQSNITVSRFLRLLMVNIAKFRVGQTDMAAFGNNYLPVLAEAEKESPWEPLKIDLGYKQETSLITVLSSIGTGYHFIVRGDVKEHLKILTQEVIRTLGSQMAYVLTTFGPEWHPVLGMTPLVASILAQEGYTKSDLKKYIYDNARLPAHVFENMLQQEITGLTIPQAAKQYNLPPDFYTSDDPNRLVPLFHNPDELFIVVSGMPQRNRAFVMATIGHQGLATSKEIKLPSNWQKLLSAINI
jgi:hypothetical protein